MSAKLEDETGEVFVGYNNKGVTLMRVDAVRAVLCKADRENYQILYYNGATASLKGDMKMCRESFAAKDIAVIDVVHKDDPAVEGILVTEFASIAGHNDDGEPLLSSDCGDELYVPQDTENMSVQTVLGLEAIRG